ncbi:MAG: hypothetical protein ACLTWR_04115 [Agathobaculum desmolans]
MRIKKGCANLEQSRETENIKKLPANLRKSSEMSNKKRTSEQTGRIPASGLGSAIERYANQLSEKRKDTRAGNQLFNDMLRGKR